MSNIFELKNQLNLFLEEHPELKEMQLAIDLILNGANNQHNRCVLLQEMMKDRVNLLSEKMIELKNDLDNLTIQLEKLK